MPWGEAFDRSQGGFRPFSLWVGCWATGGMFVGQEVTLDLSFAMARARLLALTAGNWLRDASGKAFAEGYAELARAGPSGGTGKMPGLARVKFLHPQPHDQIMIVPLRWEAARVQRWPASGARRGYRADACWGVYTASVVGELPPAGGLARRRARQAGDARCGYHDHQRVAAQDRNPALPRGAAGGSAASCHPLRRW